MSDKRKAFETIFTKLQKLLPLLGSDKIGEADNARQAINRLLASAKLDWHDLLTLLSDRKDPILEMLGHLLEKEADALVRLGLAGAKFFCSTKGPAYADIVVGGHRLTWPLLSPEFSDWLVRQFFLEKRKAPPLGAMKTALRTLGAHARFDGARHEVHLRSATLVDKIYLDLGDEKWRAIEIDKSGWRVISNPPVRFRRTSGMTALPLPQSGSIEQLRRFVNLTDAGFTLVVSVLADALCPGRPHPLLYLVGEEGSAKSTTAKIARSLIDPSVVPLRGLPRTVRDLFVSASNSHMLVGDNVSKITSSISDALCMITSGSGFATRKMFTDSDQILVDGSHPVILTGLTNAITRSDLADRAVIVSLLLITSGQRRSDAQLWADFEKERPQIFGGLLDVVAFGLQRQHHVRPPHLPRMADFALWAIACEEAFATPGAFLAAFEASVAEAIEVVIEDDFVAIAVGAFMTDRSHWSGTAAQLLHDLTMHDRAEAQPSKWNEWPREPASLGKKLRAAKGSLRKIGIEVLESKATSRTRTRLLELRKVEQEKTPQQPPRQRQAAAGGSDNADAAVSNHAVEKVDPGP